MWLLYYAGMYLFVLGIRVSSLWNHKSAKWLEGRRNWKSRLNTLPKKTSPRIWFHVSSLGEFEQAKPVIERIKFENQNLDIILTFFSPSGYLNKHDYRLATVLYLPPDTYGNAEFFIKKMAPDIAVFVKYDLWPGYIRTLINQNIPAILISAHWTPGNALSSWSLPITQSLLKNFKKIFLQRDDHLEYFHKRGFTNIAVAGDTRIDRSMLLSGESTDLVPFFIKACAPFDLVAGSTWEADEILIIHAIEKLGLRVIIAPHDVSQKNIERLMQKFSFNCQLFSQLNNTKPEADVLVIDHIGLLSALYSVGTIAYVGGGFGKGIHNILEPAAHKKPIIFGTHYHKFPEALELLKREAAWSVSGKDQFTRVLNELLNNGRAEKAGEMAYNYLKECSGATAIVSDFILETIH